MHDDARNDPQTHGRPGPHPDLAGLDRLVGTWEVSGGTRGTVNYEWLEGGFFLVQRVDLEQEGQVIKGLEVIGHERRFGEAPGEEIRSRFYANTGDTLDYVYEMEGDVLKIWAGEKGSPAYFRGAFGDGGDTLTGAWHYPGGGGYEATSTRVSQASSNRKETG